MPTLFVDLMSQPSRACVVFCRHWQLPVEERLVRIDKGQPRSKEFRAEVNPLGKVPCLVDGEQHIPESAAILQYLCTKYAVPPSWCPPTDVAHLATRARFDAAMHWQHTTVRLGATRLVFHSVLGKRLGVPVSAEVAQHGREVLTQALADLQSYWLQGGKQEFMLGSQLALPDLLVVCELEQTKLLVLAPGSGSWHQLMGAFPQVAAWAERVRAALNPHYDEVHRTLWSVAEGAKRSVDRARL